MNYLDKFILYITTCLSYKTRTNSVELCGKPDFQNVKVLLSGSTIRVLFKNTHGGRFRKIYRKSLQESYGAINLVGCFSSVNRGCGHSILDVWSNIGFLSTTLRFHAIRASKDSPFIFVSWSGVCHRSGPLQRAERALPHKVYVLSRERDLIFTKIPHMGPES